MRRASVLSTALLLAFVIVITAPAHAQSISGLGGSAPAPLTLTVSPQYPAPYQTVTITPQSTSYDISSAQIAVTVNGTPLYKGSGGQSVQVTMGGPGSITHINVSMTVSGSTYSQSLSINPASVALVVEPISTTHPFYEGRGLVSANGGVRLVAVPDLRKSSGQQYDPSQLEYTWKLGDQILQQNSGIGKEVLNATAPQRYRDAPITVTVQNSDSSVVAQASTDISPTDPYVLVYRNDPLMGPLYDNALTGSVTMPGNEDTYRGVPYYFSEIPTLAWTVNGATQSTGQDITVRATGNGQGTAQLGLSATQSDTGLGAASTISVLFGQSSTGIFGL